MKNILLVIAFAAQLAAQSIYSPSYPRWLKSESVSSDQTSGITYLRSVGGVKEFITADDIGFIRRIFLTNDTLFTIKNLVFTDKAESFLKDFPKRDFEEISVDKSTGKVYLSIEGNNPDFKKWVGIYQLSFLHDDIYNDTICAIEKLKISPESQLLEYTDNNIGFEGFSADSKYFYAALEGFANDGLFVDSTFIYVIDKKSMSIVKSIPTKKLGIHTICGLYTISDRKLLALDRNQRMLFMIQIDKKLNAKVLHSLELPPAIPDYTNLPYMMAVESVTMDEEQNIYLIDDPWKKMFSPEDKVFAKLDETAKQNFKNFVPIIYKLSIKTLTKEK